MSVRRRTPRPFDRSKEPYRSDPLIQALTDEQIKALAGVMLRLARSYGDRIKAQAKAEGVTWREILRRNAEAAFARAAERDPAAILEEWRRDIVDFDRIVGLAPSGGGGER